MSCFSRVLLDPTVVSELIKAPDAGSLRSVFVAQAADRLAPAAAEEMALFQILVQDEELFHRLLDIVGAAAGNSMIVLEGQNLGAYLDRMPLFAAF